MLICKKSEYMLCQVCLQDRKQKKILNAYFVNDVPIEK